MIPYQPVDPDDLPSRAELGEPREDARDYHHGPPDPEIASLFWDGAWAMTDPPADPDRIPF